MSNIRFAPEIGPDKASKELALPVFDVTTLGGVTLDLELTVNSEPTGLESLTVKLPQAATAQGPTCMATCGANTCGNTCMATCTCTARNTCSVNCS
jgi:hypothetical protein